MGTHNDDIRFWMPGRKASDGSKPWPKGVLKPLSTKRFERLATRERRTDFFQVMAFLDRLQACLSISRSGAITLLVTLVSMVAPSPDWFTGVSALSLLEGGQWVEELTVELFAYDAGTDSGTTYNSADDPTSPRESIQRIDGRPLAVGGQVAPVGTFTFTRR